MTYLHNNKQLFSDILDATQYATGISRAIIEKDYFVTLLLQKIVEKCPNIIFKGGTSLSKCYKMIYRFSEDIDLGLNVAKATQGIRRNLKTQIINAIKELNFTLDNYEHIFSRTYFNRYQILYPYTETVNALKQFLYVETALFIKPFPLETKKVDSYIYQFLKKNNQDHIIERYNLKPFSVNVQSLERTFIDKLFALGDYYLTNKSIGYSRHLYDLYKIMPNIVFDDNFYSLFNEVKQIRILDQGCPSANQNLKSLLIKICETDYFLNDYIEVTTKLLFETVSYQTVKNNLLEIISKME